MTITKNGLPEFCEFCGSKLVMDGVHLVCSNPNCNNLDSEELKAWCLNLAPIDGLGWKTIEKCLKLVGIHKVSDIYTSDWEKRFAFPAEQVATKKGEKYLFNQMLVALHESKNIGQFLLALKIPGLGKKGAEAIEDHSDFAGKLFLSILNEPYTDSDLELRLAQLIQDGKTAHFICTDNDLRQQFIECAGYVRISIGNWAEIRKEDDNSVAEPAAPTAPAPVEESKPVEPKGSVVITGKLSMKRADFEKLLKANGWKLGSSISKNTKYLITNDPDSGTEKNKKADALGIPKVTEEQFMELI